MTLQSLDFAVLGWIQASLRCGFLDFLMPKITLLAENGILLILAGCVLLFRKSRRVCALAELSGLAAGLLAGNLALKNLIARPRPCWLNPEVSLLIPVPEDFSFPSGHTLHCFIAAAVFMHYDRRLGWPMLVIAVLVGFSRLYLYVHFPTDVLAGAALGAGLGLLSAYVWDRIMARRAGGTEAA